MTRTRRIYGRERVRRDILRVMPVLDRSYGRVYPWMVQARLDYYRAEATIRADMAQMAREGLLVRLGERLGYRLGESYGWRMAA